MSRNIALIGMMGAGKSTIAELLGERLGRRVVDTDEEIERWRGASIPEIFEDEGERAFRDYEASVIEELARIDDLVLSLGGGAVLADGNVAAFLLTGVLVYLDVPAPELIERLKGAAEGRPLLDGDLVGRVEALHEQRDPRYREVADAVIPADGAPEVVTDRVIEWLSENPDVVTPSEYERIMR